MEKRNGTNNRDANIKVDTLEVWRRLQKQIKFPKPGTKEHKEWFPELYLNKTA